MPFVLVRQETSDFSIWKQAFESMAAKRAAMGCVSTRLMTERDNPNRVAVLFEFTDEQKMRAYIASAALAGAHARGLVVGETAVVVLDPVPRGDA